MAQYLGVGDVARKLGVRPSRITQLFYERRLRDDLCPIVSGRRLIPPDYIGIISLELRRKGIQTRPVEQPEPKTAAEGGT